MDEHSMFYHPNEGMSALEILFAQLEIITCPFPPVVLSVFWDELLLLFLLIEKCGIGYAGYASHVKASCYVVLLRVLVLT